MISSRKIKDLVEVDAEEPVVVAVEGHAELDVVESVELEAGAVLKSEVGLVAVQGQLRLTVNNNNNRMDELAAGAEPGLWVVGVVVDLLGREVELGEQGEELVLHSDVVEVGADL